MPSTMKEGPFLSVKHGVVLYYFDATLDAGYSSAAQQLQHRALVRVLAEGNGFDRQQLKASHLFSKPHI